MGWYAKHAIGLEECIFFIIISHYRSMAQPIPAASAVSAAGEVKNKAENKLSSEHGRHNFTLGAPQAKMLSCTRKNFVKVMKFFSKVSHMFSCNCHRGEEITAVLAYDVWSDDTGGYPERKSGGVGQDAVSIRVTSQYRRGFHFKFIVYCTC